MAKRKGKKKYNKGLRKARCVVRLMRKGKTKTAARKACKVGCN